MAAWVKTPDNSYYNISTIRRAYVDTLTFDGKPYIFAEIWQDDFRPIRGPFVSLTAAQTALDNAIVNLGGSI